MRFDNSLDELFNFYQTDKGSEHASKHNYSFVYDKFLSPYQNRKINLLEMGLCVGGPEWGGIEKGISRQTTNIPSINAWLEYFPLANIYGFDISDFSQLETERFRFIRGDMGKEDDLRKLLTLVDSFDIIIDDGSHASYHQQLSFLTLFPALNSGGVYIIEDVNWQPPDYENTLPRSPTTLDLFCGFLKTGKLNRYSSSYQKLVTYSSYFSRKLKNQIKMRKNQPISSLVNPVWENTSKWQSITDMIESVVISVRTQRDKVILIFKK